MTTSLSQSVTRAYVKTSLLLSAYAPLALIFAVRLESKDHPVKAIAFVGLFIAATLNLVLMFRITRSQPEDYHVKGVESGSAELAAFVATYLLPFVLAGDVTNLDLVAYAIYMLIVAIISLRGDYLHLNPLLAICGFRLYTVTTGMDRKRLTLSRERIREGDLIEARDLSTGTILVTSNRSERERRQNHISTDY